MTKDGEIPNYNCSISPPNDHELTGLRVGKTTDILQQLGQQNTLEKTRCSKSGTANCWAAAMDCTTNTDCTTDTAILLQPGTIIEQQPLNLYRLQPR